MELYSFEEQAIQQLPKCTQMQNLLYEHDLHMQDKVLMNSNFDYSKRGKMGAEFESQLIWIKIKDSGNRKIWSEASSCFWSMPTQQSKDASMLTAWNCLEEKNGIKFQ